jgi:hypothetical protein
MCSLLNLGGGGFGRPPFCLALSKNLKSWTTEEMPNERMFKRRPKIQSKKEIRG